MASIPSSVRRSSARSAPASASTPLICGRSPSGTAATWSTCGGCVRPLPGTWGPTAASRPRADVSDARLWPSAQRRGCHMLVVWGLRSLYAGDMWADDRIHLSPKGHHLVAEQALATLESGQSLPVEGFGVPARPTRAIREVMSEESRWAKQYLAPWVGRRLRGESSGDRLD